ncbi:GbsR/MarR family transcriptional regulator [Streptomyces sp. NPDC055078]
MAEGDQNTQTEREFADALAEQLSSQMPRMAGRILGALVITDEPYLSSKDLGSRLGASSATISTMGRLLISVGLVRRTVSPESRRDLFTLADNPWVGGYRNGERYIRAIVDLVDQHLTDPDLADTSRAKLREMRNMYAFLWAEVPQIVTRYEEWNATHGPDAIFHPPHDTDETQGDPAGT